MFDVSFHIAFVGPGGPEFIVVVLVLIMMFGSKDAPRILRKLNEIIGQIRNTANDFKREVMYGDLDADSPAPSEHDEDYEYDGEEYDYDNEDYGLDEEFETGDSVVDVLDAGTDEAVSEAGDDDVREA